MKNTPSADFWEDRIDVITNFTVITNVVLKKIHCKLIQSMVLTSHILSPQLLSYFFYESDLKMCRMVCHHNEDAHLILDS